MADHSFRLRSCRSIRDQLSAFLDDEVGDADALDIARHVARCEACAAELEDVRVARDAVRALPTLPVPETLTEPPAAASSRSRPLVLLGAVGCLLAASMIFVAGGRSGEVVPPVDDLVVDHVNNSGGDVLLTPVRVER